MDERDGAVVAMPLTSSVKRLLRAVRRRTGPSVRVVYSEEPGFESKPIFLVGVFRSGTTLLRNVVDSHTRIACPPESRFLIPLSELLNTPKYADALTYLGFSRDHVARRCRSFASYFFENYARSQGKFRWADKTPRYVEHLEFVHELFPDAQYVVIHRHGLDVANSLADWWARGKGSFMRDFVADAGGEPRVGAALFWRSYAERILAFTDRHPASCYTIRYEDLCAAPEATLRPMFAFLGEEWEREVLEHHRFEHDTGFGDSRAGREEGFSARTGAHLGWPPHVRESALALVGPMLSALGYGSSDCLESLAPTPPE